MSDLDICQDDVEDKLKGLNIVKSPPKSSLYPRVLYETRASIAYPLYLIYYGWQGQKLSWNPPRLLRLLHPGLMLYAKHEELQSVRGS